MRALLSFRELLLALCTYFAYAKNLKTMISYAVELRGGSLYRWCEFVHGANIDILGFVAEGTHNVMMIVFVA